MWNIILKNVLLDRIADDTWAIELGLGMFRLTMTLFVSPIQRWQSSWFYVCIVNWITRKLIYDQSWLVYKNFWLFAIRIVFIKKEMKKKHPSKTHWISDSFIPHEF